MNHPFLVKLRYLSANLSEISDEKIDTLIKLRTDYTNDAEKVIIQNSEIGKAYLISNLKELINDLSLIETRVTARLEFLRKAGLDEYDKSFANSKEVISSTEDGLSGLLQLLKIYFPNEVKNYQSLFSKYLPFDANQMAFIRTIDDRRNDPRSNEEIFLSKIILNRFSNYRCSSVKELIEIIEGQASFRIKKYKIEIEKKISIFHNSIEGILNGEIELLLQEYNVINHGYLLSDEVLKDSYLLEEEVKLLSDTIYYFESEQLGEIFEINIQKIVLLKKIEFLKGLKIQKRIQQHVEEKVFLPGFLDDKNNDHDKIIELLKPLSGSWKRRPAIDSHVFQNLLEDVQNLLEQEKLPSKKNQIKQTGFPSDFIRKTFNKLYKEFYPKANPDKRKLWITFIHQTFEQFKDVEESVTSKKFTTYVNDYTSDKNSITYN